MFSSSLEYNQKAVKRASISRFKSGRGNRNVQSAMDHWTILKLAKLRDDGMTNYEGLRAMQICKISGKRFTNLEKLWIKNHKKNL